uniref:Putative secreted protein n=1 Tax=Anopheles marajoara TaxID=58244 RepID=A0A2M4CC95_9DIPT
MKKKLMLPWPLPIAAVPAVAASAGATSSPTVAVLVYQVSSRAQEWRTFVSKPPKLSRQLTTREASAVVAVAAEASTQVADRL